MSGPNPVNNPGVGRTRDDREPGDRRARAIGCRAQLWLEFIYRRATSSYCELDEMTNRLSAVCPYLS